MEMRRYVRHSAAWWIVAIVLLAVTAGNAVMGAALQKSRETMEPVPLTEGKVYLDDFHYIDVQYLSEWIYKVTHSDTEKEVFYMAWDTEGYGYLVRLDDEQYAQFAAIVEYTYADDSDLLDTTGQSEEALSQLSAHLSAGNPAAETPEAAPAAKPAPIRLSGIICATPEDYIADIADHDGTTSEEFIEYYGDYYIDATMLPTDTENPFFIVALSVFCWAVIFLTAAIAYSSQFHKELNRLKKAGLLERAESEFHYLQGDPHSDALVSTAFVYGRHQNLMLPLADVLWVYRHEMKLLWFRRVVVQLMTYDGRSYTLRLSHGASRRTADAIVQAVASRNPEALVGLTRENHRLYDRQVPRVKQQYNRMGVFWVVWMIMVVIINVVLRIIQ